jgi:hypothetical protein
MTAAPAIPIPVLIGAAAPEADTLLAIELADDVAELATLLTELATLLTELLAELSAELPSLLAEESTLEMLELTEAATELREEETRPLRREVELTMPAVAWPAWAEVRERRVERVRRRAAVSCILRDWRVFFQWFWIR